MAGEITSNDSSPERLALAMRRTHAAIDALDGAMARHLGIGRNDLRCVNLLEHGPLPPGELGRRLGLTSGSLTALADRLEQAGLARRIAGGDDRRVRAIELTPAAFAKIGPLYRGVALALADAAREEAVRAAMIAALDLVAETVEQATAAVPAGD